MAHTVIVKENGAQDSFAQQLRIQLEKDQEQVSEFDTLAEVATAFLSGDDDNPSRVVVLTVPGNAKPGEYGQWLAEHQCAGELTVYYSNGLVERFKPHSTRPVSDGRIGQHASTAIPAILNGAH